MTRGWVHIVDDDASLRAALTRLLQAAEYGVRSYASAGEYLLHTTIERPACLLLDVRMPGPSGIELQEALAQRSDTPPIIFLTAHGDMTIGVRAMKQGAVDFLVKPVVRETLLAAISQGIERDVANHTDRQRVAVDRQHYATLSDRERDVLARIVAGKLNKQIASDLGLSERTIKAHRAQVMAKMCAGSLADLVKISERIRGGMDAANRASP